MRFDGIRWTEGKLSDKAVQRYPGLADGRLPLWLLPYLDDGGHPLPSGSRGQIAAYARGIQGKVYDVDGMFVMEAEQRISHNGRPWLCGGGHTLMSRQYRPGRSDLHDPTHLAGCARQGPGRQHPYFMSSFGQTLRLIPDWIFLHRHLAMGFSNVGRVRLLDDKHDFHMDSFSGFDRVLMLGIQESLTQKTCEELRKPTHLTEPIEDQGR